MIDVLFLVLPDTLLLDLVGPAEAFRLANQQLEARGRPTAFKLRYLCAQPQATTSIGLQIAGLEPLPDTLPPGAWVVLLGRPGLKETLPTLQRNGWLGERHWLTRVVAPAFADDPSHRLLTVCVGTLLAADAGLLARRRVTTHHEHLDAPARLAPDAQVCANRVFVVDGPVWSSAGVTTGIDLALHCIGHVCGEATAAAVAERACRRARTWRACAAVSPSRPWRAACPRRGRRRWPASAPIASSAGRARAASAPSAAGLPCAATGRRRW